MTLQLSTVSSSLLAPNVAPGVVDISSRPIDLMMWLQRAGLTRQSMGSQPFKWNVLHTANSDAEVFVEGQSPPTPGVPTFGQASLAPFYGWTLAKVTGHVRDNIARGGYYVDPAEAQLRSKTIDLFALFESNLLGSTQDRGIASIIDADDTYAGIAPGAVSAWAAKETNVAGALAVSTLEDAYEDITAAPYNATPGVILAAPNQITNYSRLAGSAGTTTPIMRMTAPGQSGQVFDVGMLAASAAFNGIPFEKIRGLTSTEIYMLDLSMNPETGEPGVCLVVHRDLAVRPYGIQSDSDVAQLSMAMCLKVFNRRRHLKLRGITA